GAALWNVQAGAPGRVVERCVGVRYAGTLPAEVRLYATGTGGTAGPFLDVAVEVGTGSATGGACTSFTPAGPPLWSGTLTDLLATHGGWDDGVALPSPAGAAEWVRDDVRVFRMRASLRDDPAANGGAAGPLTTGVHGFVWEARGG
ncbi:MAG TPA: hypothetical protein VNT51_12405, partial [Miltoncostaeaceae bacterium]|nr:hypothetical protein [Miltoncostaeaceae bacterium]